MTTTMTKTEDLWVLRRDGVVVLIGPYADLLRRVRSQADGGPVDPWARWTLTRYADEGAFD